MFVVESVEQPAQLKARARFVPRESLAGLVRSPAQVFATAIPLKNIKVDSVRNAVSQVLSNRNLEFTMDIPSANTLYVIGFGPTLAALSDLLAAVDVPGAPFQEKPKEKERRRRRRTRTTTRRNDLSASGPCARQAPASRRRAASRSSGVSRSKRQESSGTSTATTRSRWRRYTLSGRVAGGEREDLLRVRSGVEHGVAPLPLVPRAHDRAAPVGRLEGRDHRVEIAAGHEAMVHGMDEEARGRRRESLQREADRQKLLGAEVRVVERVDPRAARERKDALGLGAEHHDRPGRGGSEHFVEDAGEERPPSEVQESLRSSDSRPAARREDEIDDRSGWSRQSTWSMSPFR